MTGNKIKIALCISGEPRDSMVSFSFIYESFLRPYPNLDIDVYVHSFKPYRALELYLPTEVFIDYNDESLIYNNHICNWGLNPQHYIKTPFRNTFLMHYGIQKSFKLTKEKEYDYYIRLRPDIIFSSRVDLNYIINSLKVNNKDMWVPHCYGYEDWEYKLNDQFAVCNLKSFRIYTDLVNNLHKLILQTNSYIPEELLGTFIKENNIKVERGDVEMSLLRKARLTTYPQRNFIAIN